MPNLDTICKSYKDSKEFFDRRSEIDMNSNVEVVYILKINMYTRLKIVLAFILGPCLNKLPCKISLILGRKQFCKVENNFAREA